MPRVFSREPDGSDGPGATPAEALSRDGLQRHNQLLYEIVSQTGRDANAQVRHALERTTALLGLDRGLLARVVGETYLVEACYDTAGDLQVSDTFDLSGTYCSVTLKRDGLVAFDDVATSETSEHECHEAFTLTSYIGVPVYVEGGLYGVLAFAGTGPKQPPFSEADRSLVQLLERWVGPLLERRAVWKAGRRNEERLRLLAENVSDMVCLQDTGGRCMYVSPSSRRLLGYEPEDLIGVSSLDLTHPDDVKPILAAAARVLRGEPDVTERARLRHADGSYRWCETAGHPVYKGGEANGDDEIVHFLTSTRAIGERVRTEQELERANAELRLRNRELRDFAHIASHDLQEPLRKVRAFAELMREDYTDEVDETGRYYLERMEDGARRMSRLVSDLLGLSRVTTQGNPFQQVALTDVAAAVRTDLEMRIEETNGRVEIGSLPELEADPTQMRQLLQNLIGNALKFHREGVPPVVQVRGARVAPSGTTVPEETASDADAPEDDGEPAGEETVVRLVVEDNGIGFEEKFLDRIFTPLQRLNHRDAYDGTGIGLAVCRRIAERHGGTIQAVSTPGEGSRFTVLLPARQTAPDERPAADEAAPSSSFREEE